MQGRGDDGEYLHTYENDLGQRARDIIATDRAVTLSSCTLAILVRVQSGHLINQGPRTRDDTRLVSLSVVDVTDHNHASNVAKLPKAWLANLDLTASVLYSQQYQIRSVSYSAS